MKKSKAHKAAGGLGSKNVVRKGLRTGKDNLAINPAQVAQVGKALAEKPEDWRNGPSIQSGLGNAIAEKVRCGPGGSRTVHICGTQDQHGPAAKGR